MQRGILAGLLIFVLATAAHAASPVTINNAANTGTAGVTNGALNVTLTGGTGTSQQVVGNVAAAAVDSGNPVKVGCKYNSASPTYSDGQRTDCQTTANGSLQVFLNGSNYQTATSDGVAAVTGLVTQDFARLFNGTTYDRAFTCTSTAVINVTAAATTQIVGLSGSTVIRICSIAISMSAAGTAGVYTGTGTNCGTGTTALIQDMTLPTGTPLALSAPSGGSLVRSSAGGEICVKAVTGNVTGFLSYTQF